MPLPKSLKNKSQNPEVRQVQTWLIALGFPLTKFGADGVLGEETLRAYGNFLVSRGLRPPGDQIPTTITPSGYAAIEAAAGATTAPPANYFDERPHHPHSGRSVATPYRAWSKVTAIVLHQTATQLGEKPARWHSVPIHVAATRDGKIIQLYDFTEVCNHANGLNGSSIGIEIDGWYEGIQGDLSTLWQPDKNNPRKAMEFTATHRDAVRSAIIWIRAVVAANGGEITHIHAHRQASKERQSDPGSAIWGDIGLWAQSTHGLSDGGAKFQVGTGLRTPRQWDARYPENPY